MLDVQPFELFAHFFGLFIEFILGFPISIYELITNHPVNVRSQVVVITGAGGGIGSRLATEFAALGAKLVLVDKNEETNLNTKRELESFKVPVKCITADVTDANKMREIAGLVAEDIDFGPPYILICNAGVFVLKSFLDHSVDDIRNVFDVNILAYFWTIRAFLPSMLSTKTGKIVMVSSIAGFTGHIDASAYCSSKYAIRGLMECLNGELQENHPDCDIKVSNVYPSLVNTKMIAPFLIKSKLSMVAPDFLARDVVPKILKGRREIFVPFYAMFYFQMLKPLLPYRCQATITRILDTKFTLRGTKDQKLRRCGKPPVRLFYYVRTWFKMVYFVWVNVSRKVKQFCSDLVDDFVAEQNEPGLNLLAGDSIIESENELGDATYLASTNSSISGDHISNSDISELEIEQLKNDLDKPV